MAFLSLLNITRDSQVVINFNKIFEGAESTFGLYSFFFFILLKPRISQFWKGGWGIEVWNVWTILRDRCWERNLKNDKIDVIGEVGGTITNKAVNSFRP